MTSEILFVNGKEIVMAADSAVTVGSFKTFNGVDKIFELSNYPAVGIMIYGSPVFENVPMESLIKHFRDECDITKMDSLIDVKDDLLDFMLAHTQNTDFKALMESHLHEFREYIEPKLNNLNEYDSIKYLNHDMSELPSFLDNFSDIIESFNDFFTDLVPASVDESNVGKFASCLKNLFLDYVLNMGTGIVIAGFTQKDLYPSVISFIASLNYHDDVDNTDKIGIIDYTERLNIKGNAIFLYAQKDVIENFLNGISGDVDKHLVSYLRDTLTNLLNEIKHIFNSVDYFDEGTLFKINRTLNLFDERLDAHVVRFEDNIADLKKASFKPVVDCVGFVPRDDLVNLAESLINITSLRRKFDFNLDTVGGDIDVAILASGEAFYWKNK